MAAAAAKSGGGSSSVPSLPPPCPKSPPEYPDLYGKRREMARVLMLEREIGFLEEELKSVQGFQPASRCCKEVTDFVVSNPDPLIPTYRKNRKSCRFWKWLWYCCLSFCSCFVLVYDHLHLLDSPVSIYRGFVVAVVRDVPLVWKCQAAVAVKIHAAAAVVMPVSAVIVHHAAAVLFSAAQHQSAGAAAVVLVLLDPVVVKMCHAVVPAANLNYLLVQIAHVVVDGHALVPSVQRYPHVPIVQKTVVTHAVYSSSSIGRQFSASFLGRICIARPYYGEVLWFLLVMWQGFLQYCSHKELSFRSVLKIMALQDKVRFGSRLPSWLRQ
ncbi:hypothetical protein Tsubulata_007666 [Turnera subulata]|uniref:G protein gamma domain-containing protein n=1 Tax=Turnera subulata TaxID=218843 RepID=A0A9Q0FQR1_9ROSI|nr:hypothetical protein Tsubulata_007666 [Turnera subulata]